MSNYCYSSTYRSVWAVFDVNNGVLQHRTCDVISERTVVLLSVELAFALERTLALCKAICGHERMSQMKE